MSTRTSSGADDFDAAIGGEARGLHIVLVMLRRNKWVRVPRVRGALDRHGIPCGRLQAQLPNRIMVRAIG